jgi:phosphoglycolate phosphatase-like HAD superfamily hydrolase
MQSSLARASIALLALVCASGGSDPVDPLPSWNDGPSRAAIVAFVADVTDSASPRFVPEEQRIAVFDNDGTLWAEQPLYFQFLFAMDRVRELAPQHPEWKDAEPFRSVLAGDVKAALASGNEGLLKIVAASHAGLTADAFADSVRAWLGRAVHPTTKRPYTQMVYQPMLELLDYLRANGFKTYIVSGGGVDFMRVFAEGVYGIPPEQVVGSTGDAKFELRDGVPTIVKEAELVLLDDKEGKPVGIHRHIGRRPLFAAGNSDGDLQMLQYTTIARGKSDTRPSFGLLVHHTDAEREWAYDRESHIGTLDKALDEAAERGWTVVDMKSEWKTIYPPAK